MGGVAGAVATVTRNSTRQRVLRELDELDIRAGTLQGRGDQAVESATQAYETFDPEQFLGAEALRARYAAAAPAFQQVVENRRSVAARRGQRGPNVGNQEADLAEAFQRDLISMAAEQGYQRAQLALGRAEGLRQLSDAGREEAFATRGQGLELLLGERDLEVAAANARRQSRAQLVGAGLGALGAAAGAL